MYIRKKVKASGYEYERMEMEMLGRDGSWVPVFNVIYTIFIQS
jgi:hypothetical protein